MALVVIMLGISGPYMYHTFEIYNYIQEHFQTKAGSDFIPPSMKDLWITAISAVSIFVLKHMIIKGSQPLVRAVIRETEEDSEEQINLKVF